MPRTGRSKAELVVADEDRAQLLRWAQRAKSAQWLALRSKIILLSFTVGDEERHQLEYHFNKFWGNLSISVDGAVVRRDFRLFSLSPVKSYELTVGDTERHTVRIEKTRPLAMAGFQPQAIRAFVDGSLVAEGAA